MNAPTTIPTIEEPMTQPPTENSLAVTKITPAMQEAWVNWDPGRDPEPQLTVRQSSFVRQAFFDGWLAALSTRPTASPNAGLADPWGDEVSALVDAAFETVSRNPSDHETALAYRRAILAALRQQPSPADEAMVLLREALDECVAVLVDPVVGTVHHDDPAWYGALDKAVSKARAALAATGEGK